MTFKANFWLDRKWLAAFILAAFSVGTLLESTLGNKIDYWIHDAGVVFQARHTWPHTGVVVLDDDIPLNVDRKQALPLFALATERLLENGARGVFLDVRIAKELEGIMPYAKCIRADRSVRWSKPSCTITENPDNKCLLTNSAVGEAPLKIKPELLQRFRIAPYISGQEQLPDFLLYDWEAEAFIPKQGLVAQDRLATKETSIARWIDLSADHAAIVMSFIQDREKTSHSLSAYENESCDEAIACRRIRLSLPVYRIQNSGSKLVLPVSTLASCNKTIADQLAVNAKDKVMILQMTGPTEASDVIITPMTTALFGPNLLTPGAQYLVDAVETILQEDHPQQPHSLIKYGIVLFAAITSVCLGIYYPRSYLWVVGSLLSVALVALCFFVPVVQLWPVTVTMLVYLCGALQTTAMHLIFGFREGRLISQYMPKQIHDLLISLRENEIFSNRRHQVIVLMSDLSSYTRITDLLQEPSHVLNLMNDYLSETSYVIQDKYQGWLESYIGDMVCYYWPYKLENDKAAFMTALQGAIELSLLQKRFFASVPDRYRGQFDRTALKEIYTIINAGVGMSSGKVVMGDLGPKHGVRKFGILGDPLNRAARIEGLTRLFNTEIIVTDAFLDAAETLELPIRRLGSICVKGRTIPETLYAVGAEDDNRFQKDEIMGWDSWVKTLETGFKPSSDCPKVFAQDSATLLAWYSRGLMDQNGVWHLDEK